MERRDFLALAASVPLLAAPAAADGDSNSQAIQSEPDSEDAPKDGTDKVTIDVRLY